MNVSELREILKTLPDEAECYVSVWHNDGEHRHLMRNTLQGPKISPNGRFVSLSWGDDCAGHKLQDADLALPRGAPGTSLFLDFGITTRIE